jgi:ribonucleoside-diphosphate reductase beta chain
MNGAGVRDLLSDVQDPDLGDDSVSRNLITADEEEQYLDDVGPSPIELREFATNKHVDRMRQITEASEEIPDVETLTKLEGVDA